MPASEIADKLGSTKATNIVMMGALLEETECLSPGTALSVLEDKVKKLNLLEIDRKALTAGRLFMDRTGPHRRRKSARRLRVGICELSSRYELSFRLRIVILSEAKDLLFAANHRSLASG